MSTTAGEYQAPRTDLQPPHLGDGEAPVAQIGGKGHPTGLYVLFGAEMWERFSYYGMRALLVLYLYKHITNPYIEKDAKTIYGLYTGLVYLTPLLGGFLADRFLGQRKAILIGGVVMAMGHFAMAFEPLLFLALSLLILGNGFFKPNISTMVGNLYPQDDPRRDGAYTIFYMGINLGAFFSPLVCGWLAEKSGLGYHAGFAAAGVGMILGLIAFTAFQRYLVGGFPPTGSAQRLRSMDWLHVMVISLVCLGVSFGMARLLAEPKVWPLIGYAVYVLIALYLAAMVWVFTRVGATGDSPAGVDWQRLAVILIVGLFSIVFWMGFEQAGSTLTIFADKQTDRTFSGRVAEFPPSYFQSINPFLIFALAPLFSILWLNLDRTRFKLTSTAKMGLGLILLGIGFVVMFGAAELAKKDGKVGPEWLAGFYFFATVGEICLSPIGLSLVNKLAPARVASLMMAAWFTCTAIANYLAAVIEDELHKVGIPLFPFLIATSVAPGVILLLLTKPLKRMSHGRL